MTTEISFTIEATKLMEALRHSKVDEETGKYNLYLGAEDLKVFGQQDETFSPKITPDDYDRFSKLIETYRINLKDIREVIQLAYSFWEALRVDPRATDTLIIKYHLAHKDEYRDKVYSEELMVDTLKAISRATNPVTDFYGRVKEVNPKYYQVFEDYYTHLYADVKEQNRGNLES